MTVTTGTSPFSADEIASETLLGATIRKGSGRDTHIQKLLRNDKVPVSTLSP